MKRYLIKIYGIVQGVGFRPFVYNLAIKENINGYIKNCGSFVLIDAEGEKKCIKEFVTTIIHSPPVLSRIEKIKIKPFELVYYNNFQIAKSTESDEVVYFVSPDVATCNKCIKDVNDINSRFYRYPFSNCTECGPRYSIIKHLPYDRKNTTMSKFKFCPHCEEDYITPSNRRFHAEPIACNNCGPKLTLLDNQGNEIKKDDIIKYTSELLKRGAIIAIKGIGGFHLCCDAKCDEVVKRLRDRKHRQGKSLAIMAKDINLIKEVANVSILEEEVLNGKEKPIVLLERKEKDILSKYIAPSNKYLGLFLPYTPLLSLLFENLDYCVMTSGNISDEPIIYKNEEALGKLHDVADYFLINDRDIFISLDDSVVQVVDNEVMVLRLGRGYAPLTLNINCEEEYLAVGAEQKSSYAFTQNSYAYICQYIGDLKNIDTFNFFKQSINKTQNFFKLKPKNLISDHHSGYLSSKYTKESEKENYQVYHHHAHMLSVMLEHSLDENIIGVVFDGAGLGRDDKVWGGEFLIGSRSNFERVGYLKNVKIQGLDSAVKSIWKIALSFLVATNISSNYLNYDLYEKEIVKKAIESNINCYETSSIGRLFDGVASLIDLRHEASYEGQAPLEMESLLVDNLKDSYLFSIVKNNSNFIITYDEIIYGIIEDLKNNKDKSIIITKFHNTIVEMVVKGCSLLRDIYKLNKVALSGGVFQNRYLLSKSKKCLDALNFNVFYNKKVPINDNGIAAGQLYYKVR